MKMPDSITDGPQYDDDDVEVPTDPKAIQAAKLNAILEDIAVCEEYMVEIRRIDLLVKQAE